ncbi:peptidoglycan-binding protein [Roseococcus sp. SDR]|uniref:peptidoglycan-binding domain-containing protein n=1 Tax=Roseococcus sp. SDR TaxID=2835532 RepID=UPI0027393688|nr:peptidoglycan-binding protein [Roseococcus sp. SDR]
MTPARPLAFRLPLMNGPEIRTAQLALIRQGALRGEADGVFGPMTRDAVATFQRREGLAADGIIGPETWARLTAQPALTRPRPWAEALRPYLPPLSDWHGRGERRWRLTPQGLAIEGQALPGNTPPRIAAACWARHQTPLEAAARRFAVPVELLLATACTESGGRAEAVREEPGFTSDAATPHRVSPGLMQTLISSAREALGDPRLDRAALLDAATSAAAGAAFIARQARVTGFDPPLVAIAYNAGSLRPASNPWGLVQTQRGNGHFHADSFCAFFNDALTVTPAPAEDVPNFRALLS